MVTTLNVTLDDSEYENARRVKEARGETWAEFIASAADQLDEGENDAGH